MNLIAKTFTKIKACDSWIHTDTVFPPFHSEVFTSDTLAECDIVQLLPSVKVKPASTRANTARKRRGAAILKLVSCQVECLSGDEHRSRAVCCVIANAHYFYICFRSCWGRTGAPSWYSDVSLCVTFSWLGILWEFTSFTFLHMFVNEFQFLKKATFTDRKSVQLKRRGCFILKCGYPVH